MSRDQCRVSGLAIGTSTACYRLLMRGLASLVGLTLLLASAAAAQVPPLVLRTSSLPAATVGKAYYQPLQATGGVAPRRWQVSRGKLPPGLALDVSGVLSGMPTAAGDYRFTVEVGDSARPPHSTSRDFRISIPPALSIAWTQPPRVENGGISGQLEVRNGSGETLDLTVIVVAINEVGKAFALGYQRFGQRAGWQRIPFASTVPSGYYIVHADAIGEFAPTLAVYHVWLETPGPLTVP